MTVGLIIVLSMILVLPFVLKAVEHNLEYFLFAMGILATIISGALTKELVLEVLGNQLIYFITGAVLIAGLIFRFCVEKIKKLVNVIINHIPLGVFMFLVIAILGLVSSLITGIIASLVLVEIVHALPLRHKNKILLTVIACFSIGMGAALTPIGEPLSTIVVSKMGADFFYLLTEIGAFIIPGIFALAIFGGVVVSYRHKMEVNLDMNEEQRTYLEEEKEIVEIEGLDAVFVRAFKIFVFVIALELLGAGFKPLINTFIIHLDSRLLYWINTVSAVLDNATLAAAEISPAMSAKQVQAILMGLLVSGGMLVPGNIPNIISAGKLEIKSKEWAAIGLPIGAVLLVVYFIIIFLIQ